MVHDVESSPPYEYAETLDDLTTEERVTHELESICGLETQIIMSDAINPIRLKLLTEYKFTIEISEWISTFTTIFIMDVIIDGIKSNPC